MFSYAFFARFPVTRDFPWANFLLFGIGGIFRAAGLMRAFAATEALSRQNLRPDSDRSGLLVFWLLSSYLFFYELKQLPASIGAPRVGQKAPDFTLPDQNDKPVALADLLSRKGAVLIFYRGFW